LLISGFPQAHSWAPRGAKLPASRTEVTQNENYVKSRKWRLTSTAGGKRRDAPTQHRRAGKSQGEKPQEEQAW
jgi:hypothetical protein